MLITKNNQPTTMLEIGDVIVFQANFGPLEMVVLGTIKDGKEFYAHSRSEWTGIYLYQNEEGFWCARDEFSPKHEAGIFIVRK